MTRGRWSPEAPWKIPTGMTGLVDEYPAVRWRGVPLGTAGITARVARCPNCDAPLVTEYRVQGERDTIQLDAHLVALRDGSFAKTRRDPKRPIDMTARPTGPVVSSFPVRVHCWTPTCGDRLIVVDEPLSG